jgi:ribosomal protein S27AE
LQNGIKTIFNHYWNTHARSKIPASTEPLQPKHEHFNLSENGVRILDRSACEGTFAERLAIYARKGFVSSFPLRLDFSVKEPLLWQDRLVSALKLRAESLEAEKKRERIQVILDLAALKEYMVKGGLVLQTMKCPECGAPLKLPQSGSQTRCEHCGNTIFAQDIFEKIKSLI